MDPLPAKGSTQGGQHDTTRRHEVSSPPTSAPALADHDQARPCPGSRALSTVVIVGLIVVVATPAFAASTTAPTLNSVIDNLRNWLVGLLAGVATLFLTIAGLRYVTAGGDPGQVEKAKIALKSAAIGYALAILAPLLVSILASVVGGDPLG